MLPIRHHLPPLTGVQGARQAAGILVRVLVPVLVVPVLAPVAAGRQNVTL
jgi:hypothetical protein